MSNYRAGCSIQDRIAELTKTCGSLRAVADVLGIDVGYLSRLQRGEKLNPSVRTLDKLGLRKVVIYERQRMGS